MKVGLEGQTFGRPLDEAYAHVIGGPLAGSPPSHSFILHLHIEHLLCARPLPGTMHTLVGDTWQAQAFPGAVHKLLRVSDRKTHGAQLAAGAAVCARRDRLSSGSPWAVGVRGHASDLAVACFLRKNTCVLRSSWQYVLSMGAGARRLSHSVRAAHLPDCLSNAEICCHGAGEPIIFILETTERLGRHTRELFKIINMFIFLLMMMVI